MAFSVAEWLKNLGLERYEPAFRENEIDTEVLPSITADDLREIGVTAIGHRRRMLDGIAALRAGRNAARANEAAPPEGAGAVAQPAPRAELERRNLTILFCDLVASTRLSEELDPEDYREVLVSYRDAVTRIVRRFDGFVARYLGDGLLAYFGWPAAYEHDAERAVRAGMEMTAAVDALEHVSGRPLSCRVGIATGPVVVGDLVGTSFSENDQVVGRTPNLAARVQAVAEPGTVAISPETRSIVARRVVVSDLGRHELKGLARPTRIWRVDRVLEAGDAQWRGAGPALVGRGAEEAQLRALWNRAFAGHGHGVLVRGEPGIGKSALVGEIAREAAQAGARVLSLQCSPFHANDALYPVLAQLRELAHSFGATEPGDEVAPFRRLFAAAGLDPDEAVATLGPLLDLPDTIGPAAVTLDAQGRKEKAFQALLAVFDWLATRGGLMTVVEDLHWADPTTRDFVGRLLGLVGIRSMLVVMTTRPDGETGLSADAPVAGVELRRLDAGQIDRIIVQVAGHTDLPQTLRALIASRSDGVPLFAEELTKSVIETGAAAQPSGHGLDGLPEAPAWEIPLTLRDSLVARIDRLPLARPILQTASAIGRDFSCDQVADVLEEDRAEIRGDMARLVEAGLVVPAAEAQGIFGFRHALLREVAYETMLRGDRQDLHERIATILSSAYAASTPPQVLAGHWARCGRHGAAARCFASAAATSASRYANEEAAAQYRAALSQLKRVSEPEADLPARGDLLESLADVLILMNDVDGATRALEAAMAEASDAAPLHRARLHRLLAKARQQDRAASLAALDAAEAALGPVDATSDEARLAEWIESQLIRLYVLYWSGDGAGMERVVSRLQPVIDRGSAAQRAEYFDQLALRDLRRLRYAPVAETIWNARRFVDAADEAGETALLASAKFMLGFVLMHAGTLDEARSVMTAGLETARRSGHRAIELRCMAYLATVARRMGDVARASALARDSRERAEGEGMKEYVALAGGNLAWAAWRKGDVTEAQSLAHGALDSLEQAKIAYPFEWAVILPLLACPDQGGVAPECRALCARLVDPDQQRLPDDLDTELRSASQAADADLSARVAGVVAAACRAGFL